MTTPYDNHDDVVDEIKVKRHKDYFEKTVI